MSPFLSGLRGKCGKCSGQTDGAGIVLSLECKDLEVLAAARELLLKSLPHDVTVISEEVDSRRHSHRASVDVQGNFVPRK